MLSTDATVPDYRERGPRGNGSLALVWALGVALALLSAALILALVRNATLQKRVDRAERIADERAGEIKEMAHQCGIAARVSLEKLSEADEPEAADESAAKDEAVGVDSGIDGGKRKETERW